MFVHGRYALLACLLALAWPGASAHAALTVDATACGAATTSFGGVVGPAAVLTPAACTVGFGNDAGTARLHVYQSDGVGTALAQVPDFSAGVDDWAPGDSMFGVCLESLGAGATATWGVDAGGSCTATNADPWRAVPATNGVPSRVADTTAAGSVNASLRFGANISSTTVPGPRSGGIVIEVVSLTVNTPPTTPVLVAPSSGVITTTTPTFSATFSDPDAGDTGTIEVEVCTVSATPAQTCAAAGGTVTASGSSSSVANGVDGSWVPGSALPANVTRYWRARSTDASLSTSGWSAARPFTPNGAPGTATLVSPANGATPGMAPQLVATFVDSTPGDTGTVDFEVCSVTYLPAQTCVGAGGTLMYSGSSSSVSAGANASLTASGAFVSGTTYYWRARGTDALGLVGAWSNVRTMVPTFTVPTSTTATTGAGTLVLPVPAGVQSGDLLVATVGTSQLSNPPPPAGWTQWATNGNTGIKPLIYYKVAGGSEPADYTWLHGANTMVGTMMLLPGASYVAAPAANTSIVSDVAAPYLITGSGRTYLDSSVGIFLGCFASAGTFTSGAPWSLVTTVTQGTISCGTAVRYLAANGAQPAPVLTQATGTGGTGAYVLLHVDY